MDAMILSAGLGMRMRPLTSTTPKPLLRVGSHRLIEYQLMHLRQAGIERVVINTSYLAEKFTDALGDGAKYGVQIQYVAEGNDPLETGGGIRNALPYIDTDPILIVNGDIWTDFPFESLVNRNFSPIAHLVLVPNPDHNINGDFLLQGGRVSLKRRGSALQPLTYSGISILSKQLFLNCDKANFSLVEVLEGPIRSGQVTAECYEGDWFDIGTQQRLEDLRKWLEDKAST